MAGVKFDPILGDLRQDDSGTAVNGMPVGGSTGQYLAKNSATDYDVTWSTASATDSTKVLKAGDTMSGTLNTFSLIPVTTATYGLGDGTHYWANAYVARLYVNANAYLDGATLGTAQMNGELEILNGSSTGFRVLDSRVSSSTGGAGIIGRITTDPTATGHRLGFYLLGANGQNTSGMMAYSTEAWSGTARGTKLTFATTAATTTARTERYQMDETGVLPIATATYALGGASNYWASIYASRHYLNSTAYLDGGTAGTIVVTGRLSIPGSTTGSNNQFIGDGSGNSTLTGVSNAGIGHNTFALLTSGSYNMAIGTGTLSVDTTGERNTAIGAYAMDANTTGNSNVAIGQDSLGANIDGSGNVGIGNYTLLVQTTGNYNNVAIGQSALEQNTGSNNTAVGLEAGKTKTTGDYNVYIGYQAGQNATGSNQLYIANSNTATPLIYGDFSAAILTINGSLTLPDTRNVVLGTTTGTKIGTSTSQKLGFFNATPVIQQSGNIITALANLGLIATPTLAESDVTNLTTDLGLKAPLASPTFTGTVSAADITSTGLQSFNLSPAGSTTIPAGYGTVAVRQYKVASGQKITIGSGGRLRIL